jgi:hypothetical protein
MKTPLEFLEDYLATLAPVSAASDPAAAGYREELKLRIQELRDAR